MTRIIQVGLIIGLIGISIAIGLVLFYMPTVSSGNFFDAFVQSIAFSQYTLILIGLFFAWLVLLVVLILYSVFRVKKGR